MVGAGVHDLTEFITRVNRMKRRCPVLLEEGPQVRRSPEDEPVVMLIKSRDNQRGRVLAVINATREAQTAVLPGNFEMLGRPPGAWRDLTPEGPPLKLRRGLELPLAPAEMRIFYHPQAAPLPEILEEVEEGGQGP